MTDDLDDAENATEGVNDLAVRVVLRALIAEARRQTARLDRVEAAVFRGYRRIEPEA